MKNITVYSGPMCNFCDAAKRLLVRNNYNSRCSRSYKHKNNDL